MADRKISDLTALTTPAAGDFLPIVDISEAAAASKNKRITIEELMRGVPDGTAAAPGIAFETDPNTGIYSSGANQLAAATNGVGRLFINSTGLVGIGSSAPQENLHLKGAGATSLRLETGNGVSFVSLRQNQTGNYFEISPSAASAQSLVVNRPGGSEALRVDSSGRVGIGTTPTTDILEIYGNLRFAQVSNYLKFANDSITIKRNGANALEFNSYNGFLFNDTLNSTERARLDSSGRLLIGTSTARSVLNWGTLRQQFEGTSYTDGLLVFNNANNIYPAVIGLGKSRGTTVGSNTIVASGDQFGEIAFYGADGTNPARGATIGAYVDGTPGANDMPGRLVFSTTADGASSPTERMRITSEGRVVVSSDPAGTLTGSATQSKFLGIASASTTGTVGIETSTGNTSLRYHVSFSNPNGVVGTISTNASATAYNTSSDYRLKENVTPASDGIIRLQQLKPSRFNFIADPDTVVDGFIAHEVQTIVPEAITGEKDAVDDDGNPEYQGIDQSKLVPLLTAALQEAIGEIESLKARLTAAGI